MRDEGKEEKRPLLLFGASETHLFLKICASLISKDDPHPCSPPYSLGYRYARHREGENIPYRILLPCIQLLVSKVQLRVLEQSCFEPGKSLHFFASPFLCV